MMDSGFLCFISLSTIVGLLAVMIGKLEDIKKILDTTDDVDSEV